MTDPTQTLAASQREITATRTTLNTAKDNHRDMFNHTYVLPSEPDGRDLAAGAKIIGAMLGSFAVTTIVAGLIVMGLLWLTRRPNDTDSERHEATVNGIFSVLAVSLVAAVAVPVWLYRDDAAPPPPTPRESYLGISDALQDRGSTDFYFRLDDEIGPYTPIDSLDHVIIRDSSRFNCRADVVDVEHTPESGNGHSMVSLRLIEDECDTGFNIIRWESVVREHGRIT